MNLDNPDRWTLFFLTGKDVCDNHSLLPKSIFVFEGFSKLSEYFEKYVDERN